MINLPKHPVVHGHPLHAIASDLPIGLLPGALATTLLGRGRRRAAARAASDAVTLMTFGAAAGAAALGIWDWLTIPRSHPAWTTAVIHGSINLGGVAVLGSAAFVPKRRLQLLGVAAGGLLAGSWFGGELVFGKGWRVKPAEEFEIVAERVRAGEDGAVLDDARREVANFERQKTFLG